LIGCSLLGFASYIGDHNITAKIYGIRFKFKYSRMNLHYSLKPYGLST